MGTASINQRVRRRYTPLNTSVCIVCTTPMSPLVQTTDGTNFFPDRTVVNTGIQPQINATTEDGSWDNKRSNMALVNSSIKWMVSKGNTWVDIAEDANWAGKYEIDFTETTTKGTLYVKRNISANDKQQIYFEGQLLDYRTKTLIDIHTEPVTLYTVRKGDDTYGIGIGVETNISYNPVLDKLSLYEYLVANNLKTASDAERNKCLDGNEYLKVIPIDVYLSKKRISTGYTLQVFRVDEKGKATLIAASSKIAPNELLALSLTSMTLDLRLIMKSDYIIKVVVDNKVVAQFQFNVKRMFPAYRFDFLNVSSIAYGQQKRCNKVIVHSNNELLSYPQRILKINWKTIAHNEGFVTTEKNWQEGDSCEYLIEETGLGPSEDCELEDCVEYESKPPLDFAITAEGDYLTDNEGNPYLIG